MTKDEQIQELKQKLYDVEKDRNDWRRYAHKLEATQNQKAIDVLRKLKIRHQILDIMTRESHYINQRKYDIVFTIDIDRLIQELGGKIDE